MAVLGIMKKSVREPKFILSNRRQSSHPEEGLRPKYRGPEVPSGGGGRAERGGGAEDPPAKRLTRGDPMVRVVESEWGAPGGRGRGENGLPSLAEQQSRG